MTKIKVKDKVVVIAGKDKGKTGEVLKINKKKLKVIVSGINVAKKAVKPTNQNPNGGIFQKELPIDISNIAIVDAKSGKPTRVKISNSTEGKKRVATKSKAVIA